MNPIPEPSPPNSQESPLPDSTQTPAPLPKPVRPKYTPQPLAPDAKAEPPARSTPATPGWGVGAIAAESGNLVSRPVPRPTRAVPDRSRRTTPTAMPEIIPPPPVPEPPPEGTQNHPIPTPSEPMQYRAIGLVRGRYEPSEEQFTKGNLIATDGTILDSVLLGRVMSLVKNHIDLTTDHLWVVYPRTRDEHLHLQIMGVWEPETLHQEEDPAASDGAVESLDAQAVDASEPEPKTSKRAKGSKASKASKGGKGDELRVKTVEEEAAEAIAAVSLPDATPSTSETVDLPSSDAVTEVFSIRGEVVKQDLDEKSITIKVKQAPRKPQDRGKSFKINIQGLLGNRAVGYFWDVLAERQGTLLTVAAATSIALVPPKKRPKGKPGIGKKPPRRPGGARAGGPAPRPRSSGTRPTPLPKGETKGETTSDLSTEC